MLRSSVRLAFVPAVFTLLVAGCQSEDVLADTGNETTSGDGDGDTTGDGDGDPTGDGDGDGDGDPTGDGDGDGPSCGDGTLDAGEECDDGNTDEGDGCSATCTISECGFEWSWSEDVSSSAVGGFDAAVGDDGSVYAAGVLTNANNDAWVAKWGPDGTQAFSQSFDGGVGGDAANALVLGGDGMIYVAGRMAGAGDDLWYAALDAGGNEAWSQVIDGTNMMVMDGDDIATGIALTPDGDLVIAGRTRVGDGDDDVWVRKASATDGTEIWTTTWTGTGDGMFSTDRAGSVAVGPDGHVWVTAREHVDFDTQEATLLHFDADGMFVAKIQPQASDSAHQHDPVDVVVDADAVYFAFAKYGFPYRAWVYKLATDGSEQWLKTEADLQDIGPDDEPLGADWGVTGLGLIQGNLGIAGSFTNEEAGQGITWGEAWVAKLDGAGDYICRSRYAVDDGAQIPPSLSINGASAGTGGFGVTGIETSGQGNATKLWTGSFRP